MRAEILCHDCGKDCRDVPGEYEMYMVQYELWYRVWYCPFLPRWVNRPGGRSSGAAQKHAPRGNLCVLCFEVRLGRRLVVEDFIAGLPINDPCEAGWKYERAAVLQSRLAGEVCDE